MIDALKIINDRDFLKALDNNPNKFYLVKIEILDKDEIPIRTIEGKVQSGSSINISGNSSVRRTCNINFIVDENENDLTNIKNLLSINKRIKIFEGIKNNISNKYTYGDYIWFPLGIFIIIQPNITHSVGGCLIQLSCKDKMCLLNGETAGGLPTSIVFSDYDQIIGLKDCVKINSTTGKEEYYDPRNDVNTIPNNYTIYKYITKVDNEDVTLYLTWTKEKGWEEKDSVGDLVGKRVKVPQRLYDIIQTIVHNYGGISLDKIFINDVPLQIKQLVRYVGTNNLYYNIYTSYYTTNQEETTAEPAAWRTFKYNEDVGYVYTDFTYPTSSSLVSGIGDNVCTILDKIRNLLGNYEYFFDVEGNFVFQEKRNYLNTSYNPVDEYRLDNGRQVSNPKLDKLAILNGTNYQVDFYKNTKSVYTFTEGNGLIISYSNSPNYSNIKNDFHIWGEIDDNNHPIHYHVAIKEKPELNTYNVVFLKNDGGDYNGKIRLATIEEEQSGQCIKNYQPMDWRCELYLRGLADKQKQIRPDVFEQELLDLFDDIYEWSYYDKDKKWHGYINKDGINKADGRYKEDLIYNPNGLTYFIDFLDPIDELSSCSVEALGLKVYSYQEEKIRRLYNTDVPDVIMLDLNMDSYELIKTRNKCFNSGQAFSNVDHNVFSNIAEGTYGYTAQEVARELLYQYTTYNEVISIQNLPIYYLDVNTRITINDRKTGISGDYIINSISLPLDAGKNMTINASRALERI